jgi:hypothetical protein
MIYELEFSSGSTNPVRFASNWIFDISMTESAAIHQNAA